MKSTSMRLHLFFSGVSLAAGVLWLSSCAAPPDEIATNNVANSANSLTVTTPAPASTVKTTPSPQSQSFTIFIPTADAKLSKQLVKVTDVALPTNFEDKSQRVLEFLFPKLEFLPQGTRLLEAPQLEKDGIVRLNLSRQFLQLNKSPETPVALTLDSISRTLGALRTTNGKPSAAAKVRFLAEGKTIRTLSEFSLDEPWKASDQFDEATKKPGGEA